MAHLFISRPIFAMVLSIVIVLLGAVAILRLPVAMFPPISPPLVQVQTTYIGASASVVEQTVATQIENKVVGVDNMIYMQSTSSSSGQYTLNCTFKVGADIQKALIDVQNRLQQASGKLPAAVNQFGITVQKKSPQILMVVALYSPTNSYDRLFLSNYTTLNLINPLLSVPGIGGQSLIGQQDYAMRAWVRPDRLGQAGTAAERPGRRDQQPERVDPDWRGRRLACPEEQPVPALGRRAGPAGRRQSSSATSSCARIPTGRSYGCATCRGLSSARSSTRRSALSAASRRRSSSSIRRRMRTPSPPLTRSSRELADLAKAFPPGLSYAVAYDSTLFVKDSIHDVIKTLFEAIILVIVVVFVFLGSFRTSFIPMLAVPVSLVGTFILFVPLRSASTP